MNMSNFSNFTMTRQQMNIQNGHQLKLQRLWRCYGRRRNSTRKILAGLHLSLLENPINLSLPRTPSKLTTKISRRKSLTKYGPNYRKNPRFIGKEKELQASLSRPNLLTLARSITQKNSFLPTIS